MNISVVWHEGLSFEGISPNSFRVPMGADVELGGKNDGFRPMELILIGLAGCTGMDVISIAKKKQQQIKSFWVKIQAEREAEHPRVFNKIVIEYVFSGDNLDIHALERAVQLSEEKYCPAQAMLRKAVDITHKITVE